MAETTDSGSAPSKGVSRRMMLVTGAAVAGASALIAAPFRNKIRNVARRVIVNTSLGQRMLSLAQGTYDEWAGEVGVTFALGGSTTVRLVGVRALNTTGPRPESARAQGFAAFFDPVAGRAAPDLLYTATHPTYGPLMLHLASASTASTPGRMVAVFG